MPILFNKIKYEISDINDGNMNFNFGDEKEVINNRKKFLNKINVPYDKCVGINLVHSSQIINVVENDISDFAIKTREGDALITDKKEIFLFMMTADCLPIVLFDPIKSILALVHCGWKSTNEKIVQKVISYFINNGTIASNIFAIIGPGIYKESYRIKEPIQKKLPEWKNFLDDVENEETEIDLIGYNIYQLKQSGILDKNIEISDIDTAKNKKYFSHYRSVKTGEKEGRFCTVVGMIN